MKDPIKWLIDHELKKMGYQNFSDAPPIIQSHLTEGAGYVIGFFITIGGCGILSLFCIFIRFLLR